MATPPIATPPIEGSAVKPLDDLFRHAFQHGASDIHFESTDTSFRVRCRIDGRLQVVAVPPWQLRDAMVSRLKVLARMDIAEKRVPQDGRIQYPHGADTIDLRVSSLPTLHGEKIVVRILNFSRERPSLAMLGYEPDDQDRLRHAMAQPHGMVLMTGPTGSGKTLSLYSCLDLLNRPEVNVSTVEDPSEIHLPGANQVNVNERAGLTFAVTLRALLRQDPDVIMVGEIRDTETAEIAMQAAQTGHFVLSTLHTNDAPSTLARLKHMGIAPFNVAASVLLITAQRLVRRLCTHCKTALNPTQFDAFFSQLSVQDRHTLHAAYPGLDRIYQAVGCAACAQGYQGRIGIYQIMPISEALQTLILQDSNIQTLKQQAMREGMRTLRQAGWLKVAQGLTSVEEIMALTAHG
jgi:type IV pilus assembly protein PilB